MMELVDLDMYSMVYRKVMYIPDDIFMGRWLGGIERLNVYRQLDGKVSSLYFKGDMEKINKLKESILSGRV